MYSDAVHNQNYVTASNTYLKVTLIGKKGKDNKNT